MRHRIKKIPTLSKLNHNHHLLHSDKSTYTYFYKGKVRDFFKSRLTPTQPCTNGVWYASPHQDLAVSQSESVRLNRTQRSQDITPYSAVAGRANMLGNSRFSTIPLVLSAFGLLLVLGMMISPSMSAGGSGGVLGGVNKASAVSEQDFGAGRTISLSIINNGNSLADGDTVSTNAETPGTVSYIDNTIRISTSKIAKYYVGVQAAKDGSSDLTGSKYGETIAGVGSNVSPANFGDNTWGYSLTDNTSAASNTLTYSTLPTYNSNSPLQYTSAANPADGDHDLKLAFAAKINANKPGDHYQTKAMVSVAADAKTLTLSDLTYMQDMVSDICDNTAIGANKNLTDKRDNSTYAVNKLSDGKCWMNRNLRIANKTITPADSDVVSNYNIPASSTPWSETALETNKVHYANNTTYGAYYSWYTATAGTGYNSITANGQNASGSICPKGWRLPTGGDNGDFKTLVSSGNASWLDDENGYLLGVKADGFAGAAFFPAAGYIRNSLLNDTGNEGRYWSSTVSSETKAYALSFVSGGINPSASSDLTVRHLGFSVRCVAR